MTLTIGILRYGPQNCIVNYIHTKFQVFVSFRSEIIFKKSKKLNFKGKKFFVNFTSFLPITFEWKGILTNGFLHDTN